MNTTKFQLTATQCREYDVNTGWINSDHVKKSSVLFDTLKLVQENKESFINGLKISDNEVYEISIIKCEVYNDEAGEEVIESFDFIESEIIDNSESLKNYPYQVNQYFGQYMIPQGKYYIDHTTTLCSTVNELLLRIENSSFRSHPVAVFKTELDVLEFCEGKKVISSVIEIEEIEN